MNKKSLIIPLAIFIELLLFAILNPSYLNLDNILYSTTDYAHIILVALPLTLVVITGGIDLSIGSIMGLASITIGSLYKAGLTIGAAMMCGLIAGALCGLLNGIIVAYTDIPALVITLGTMFLFSGVATGIAGSIGADGYNGISGLPDSFVDLAYGSFGIIPFPLIYVALTAVLLSLFLNRTRGGRSLFLLGDNSVAARYSGIKVSKMTLICYVISGVGAALAGTLLTAYFTSARSDLGNDVILVALTAVVLGGTAITGGVGSVYGTLGAAFFLGLFKQGLMAQGVTNNVSSVVTGIILIGAVTGRYFLAVINNQILEKRGLITESEQTEPLSEVPDMGK